VNPVTPDTPNANIDANVFDGFVPGTIFHPDVEHFSE
jgi:hypothetical protein